MTLAMSWGHIIAICNLLIIFLQAKSVGKPGLLNNYVICLTTVVILLMTPAKEVIKLDVPHFTSASLSDGSSGPNCGGKLRTTCSIATTFFVAHIVINIPNLQLKINFDQPFKNFR